jgi:hypothetical protein
MYLDRSDEDDRKTTERWKGECDAILIFVSHLALEYHFRINTGAQTGLFSAALAALLAVSVQGLQPGPQEISAFYLKNIYHLLANTTTSQPIVPPIPSDPPKFSPPKSAVFVNSLWFLSLVMSPTGALLAVFIQQWARSYLHATQGRHSPKDRARIRTFHVEGLEKFHLHWVTRAVPILIHGSLFLFFSGLPIFLFNLNRTVFNVVVTWLGLCVAGYACITLMPFFTQNSPYYSPLSSSTWWCVTKTIFIIHRLLENFVSRDSPVFQWYHTHYTRSRLRCPSLRSMQKAVEDFALKLPSEIDYRALSWMFKTLNDDNEYEQFFDALPSLCDSEELEDPQTAFINPNEKELSHALIGMMDRTLLSDLVPEEVKQRRIIICSKVIGATSLFGSWWTLCRVLCGDWHGFSRSTHFGLFVQGWKNTSHPVTSFYAQFVVAVTLASVQQRDDHWFQLASRQLNQSKSDLRNYFAYGDSILLANAIFIIRRTSQTFSGSEDRHRKEIHEASSKTLKLVCRLDIQSTFPELQHQFCILWNQLVDAAQNNIHPRARTLCTMMLKSTRKLYIILHDKTSSSPMAFSSSTDDGVRVLDDARSYPWCINNEHRHPMIVPDLPLDMLPRNASRSTATLMDMIPPLFPLFPLVSVLSPTFPTPHPSVVPSPHYSVALRPSPTAFPTPSYPVASLPPYTPSMYYPVIPSPYYPIAPGPSSHSTAPARQESPVSPPGADLPISTLAPTTSTPNIDASGGNLGPVATINRLGQPFSPPTMAMPETPPAPPMPAPAFAASPATAAAVSPVILSTPQERIPSPEPLLSLLQGLPVSPPGNNIPMQVFSDTNSTHSIGAGFPFPTPMTGGSTSVPSSAVRRGDPAQTPLTTPSVIKLDGYGDFPGLLHYSPHSVLYEDKQYPTALHLFEACKFLPDWPDLADRVRQCQHIDQVTSTSAGLANFIRPDWGNVMLSTVSKYIPCLVPRLGRGCFLTD